VDASVATRFLLKEDLAEEAERVLRSFAEGEIDLTAPPLINYEVGNALRTAASRGIIKPADATYSFNTFLRMKLGKLALSEGEYSDTLEWSIRKGVSYYDAIYILCSKASGNKLLTMDTKQLQAAEGEIEALHLRDFC
jgi:predicted nucleic acid-binding protein